MMLLVALVLSLLASCYSAEVWDPADPKCEEYRKNNKGWWDREIVGNVYGWIDYFDRRSNYNMESAYEYNSGETLKKGCWRYESFKTTEFRCWSREFLCAALEVTLKTVDGFKRKKGIRHEGWYQHFNTLSGSPQGDREEEINWVTKMRWNDPKLLYWEKHDAETLGNKMLERVYFLIDKNNIDSLRLIFDHYKASGTLDLMKQECNKIGNDNTNIRCKLAVVFDRMEELMIDSADISWNPGASGPPRTREELAMLYLLQPKVYEIMNIGSKTRNKTLTDRLKTMFQSLYDNALNQNSENVKNHFGKFGSIYENVKHDCTETYNNDFEEITCYLSETFSRMEKLSTALGADFNNWKSSRSQSMRAVILIWLLLTPKGNFYVKTTTLTRAQSAKVLLNVMYNKLRENDLNGLQEIANLIPNDDQMGLITSGEECDADFDTIMRSMKCGFKILIEHLEMYLEQYNSKTQNTKRVDLTINHETRLKQFQISSIKDEVRNTELELKNSLKEFSSEIKTFIEGSVGNRFSNLQKYFKNVASFDKEISNADIAFIDGNLRNFEKKAAKIYAELEYQGYKQQLEVTIVKAIDATFMWMKAIGSGISAMFNMMKGDFSGFAATEAAITAAAKETLNAVKSQAVYDQIKIASETFRLIIVGFKDNQKQLEKTKAIVDKLTAGDTSSDDFKQIQKDFIQAYKDYTPKVSGTQIQKLTAAWGEVVSKLESLMDSMQTKEAITASTKSFMNSQFFKTKIIVPQLSETLSGRFAFQFDLMDALTGVVRAHTSIQAAEGLSKGYSDLEPQLAKSKEAQVALDQMALSTYILSQFHLLLILSQFCNAVTYVNAGVEPFQCKNALRTMDVIHIDDALSYEPPSCDPVKVDLKIPTSDSGKADNVNLYRLNSGESVAFQIPNFDWLKVHGEMSENDRTSALFVKRFEIYVITNDSFKISKNLRVEVTPSGSAPIIPGVGQTKYELVPSSRVKYVFEYKESENCQEPNPYYVCSPGPKKICFQSPGELKNSLDAYPSIYSPWTIQLDKKIGNAPEPAPETKVYLLAKLGLCRKSEDSNISSRRGRKRVLQKMKKGKRKNHVRNDTNGVPCPQGKYFNQDSGLFAACKPGSTPQRHGYYCEVNKSGSQSG